MTKVECVNFRIRNLPRPIEFRTRNSLSGMISAMTKDRSMRKLLADKVRLWMTRVPEADTQAKLAVRARMSQSSVHRVLHEDTEPELATAYKLATAFGISVAQLLADEVDAEATDGPTLDPQRYARLPDQERQKIKAFAEFVMATHEASTRPDASMGSVSETIGATPDEQALVGRVAQRNLTTDTLSTHEPTKNHTQRPTRKRPKSAGR